MGETETNMLPTPEQLFAEAKRLAEYEWDSADQHNFSKYNSSVWWDWFSRSRNSTNFAFHGYITIVVFSREEEYANSTKDAWIRPDRLTVIYTDNTLGYLYVRFRMRDDTPFVCSEMPPRTLSTILDRLNLASAEIEKRIIQW